MTIIRAYVVIYAIAIAILAVLLWTLAWFQRRVGVRRAVRVVSVTISIACVMTLFWFLVRSPSSDEHRWRRAGYDETGYIDDPSPTVAQRLAARLGNRDTLIVVSLSGGGSRAAYFAALVLERLSTVMLPGPNGSQVPLTSQIDAISTVSGGSLAGAYFAAHAPVGNSVTAHDWQSFFATFKNAMAHDYEADVATQVLSVRRAPSFTLGRRNVAETLTESFDRQLSRGPSLTFAVSSAAKRREPRFSSSIPPTSAIFRRSRSPITNGYSRPPSIRRTRCEISGRFT